MFHHFPMFFFQHFWQIHANTTRFCTIKYGQNERLLHPAVAAPSVAGAAAPWRLPGVTWHRGSWEDLEMGKAIENGHVSWGRSGDHCWNLRFWWPVATKKKGEPVSMPKLDMIHVVFRKQCIYFVVEVNLLTLWYKVGVVFIVSLKWFNLYNLWGFILGLAKRFHFGYDWEIAASVVPWMSGGTQRGVTSMKKQTQIQIPEPTFLGFTFPSFIILQSAKAELHEPKCYGSSAYQPGNWEATIQLAGNSLWTFSRGKNVGSTAIQLFETQTNLWSHTLQKVMHNWIHRQMQDE